MSNAIPDLPNAASVKPAHATTLEDIRWQLCHLKTVALLGNVLLKQEALDRGYDEAVLVRDGLATECSASNLFMIKDEVLVTPPKSHHLLPGITRDLVVDVARANDIQIIERDIEEKELFTADELWFTSSTKAIVPITKLNDKPVGNGDVGPMWHTTIALYKAYVEQLKNGEAS
jgi:D-alanine transaminase